MSVRILRCLLLCIFLTVVTVGAFADMPSAPADTILYLPFDGSSADTGPLQIAVHQGGTISYAPGVRGEAVRFDGVSGYLEIDPVPQLQLTDVYTISFWFRLGHTPDLPDGRLDQLLRLEADTLRWSPGYSLYMEGSGDTVCFRSMYRHDTMMSQAGTCLVTLDPAAWYRLIISHSDSSVSHLLIDARGVPVSYTRQRSYVKPSYASLRVFLGGLKLEGMHPRAKERFGFFQGLIDDFLILDEPYDTETLFAGLWEKAAVSDLAPFLKGQAHDFKAYGLYGVNNSIEPIEYIDQLLSKDPLNPGFYAAKWSFYPQHRKKDEYAPVMKKELETVLHECPVTEKSLMDVRAGYRQLGMDSAAAALEKRIVTAWPAGGLARQRRIMKADSLLKIIEPVPYQEITDTLFADLKIGYSYRETMNMPEEQIDPDYMLMGINAIAVNDAGHIFAASRETFQISEYDENGVFVASLGGQPELAVWLPALRAMRFTSDGNLEGVSTREDTTWYWQITVPGGGVTLLGRNNGKGRLYKMMPHPSGLWAGSPWMTVLHDYEKDIKGDSLISYRSDETLLDLYRIQSDDQQLHIDTEWSGIPLLTSGGTLEGRFDHFTLCSLNDASYDFDEKGNIYLAHRFLPRFRKFSSSGELLRDHEYNVYGDGHVRPGIGLGNGYRLMSAFQAVRTADDGSCLLLRHATLLLIDSEGNMVKTMQVAGLPSDKDARVGFIASNGYGNKTFLMSRDGSRLYAVSGRSTIYRYSLPAF